MFADNVIEACSITGTGGYSLGGAVGAAVALIGATQVMDN